MRWQFTVEVEAQRDEGKFATRDELTDQIQEALENADPGQLDGDNGGVYSVHQWDVEEVLRKGKR